MIDVIRSLQRPFTILVIMCLIAYITIKIVVPFADADMAKTVLVFILASGTTIIGVLFGERKKK